MNTSFKKDLIKDRGLLVPAEGEYMYVCMYPKPLIRGLGIHPWLDFLIDITIISLGARVSSVGD